MIRYRLVQVRQNQKKTFRVGGPQSPFSFSCSFILSFVLLPFFLNTKMKNIDKPLSEAEKQPYTHELHPPLTDGHPSLPQHRGESFPIHKNRLIMLRDRPGVRPVRLVPRLATCHCFHGRAPCLFFFFFCKGKIGSQSKGLVFFPFSKRRLHTWGKTNLKISESESFRILLPNPNPNLMTPSKIFLDHL